MEYEDGPQCPAAGYTVEYAVAERQQPTATDRQIKRSERLEDMPDIKRRHTPVQAYISQSDKIEILSGSVPGKVREAFAPRVIGRQIHAASDSLPQLNLKTVVVAPTGVIDVIQAPGHVGIE